MNKHIKLLSAIFAVALLVGALLSGCSSTPAASSAPAASAEATAAATEAAATEAAASVDPSTLEAYQIDWLYLCDGADDGITAIEEATNKLLQPKINATIKFNMQSWNDYDNKVATLLGSGEKYDLTFTAAWRSYQTWVRQGYFQDVTELMQQYAPKTCELLGADVFIAGSAIDGKNYAVPTLKETCVPGGLVFNNAVLTKYNWDKNSIKATPDLEPWLAQYHKDTPDGTAYLTDGGWLDTPFTSISITDDIGVWTDNRDTKVLNQWDTQEMRDHVNLIYKWAQAGYLHPDSANTNFNVNDVLTTGKFLVNPQPVKGENVKADELEAYNADATADYVDVEFTQTRYVNTTHMSGSMQAIPVTSQDPVRAMMFLELLHTDADVINTLCFGIEGVNYNKTDKEGIIELVADKKWQGKLPQWMMGNVYLQYITTDEDATKNEKLKAVSDGAKINFTTGFFFDPTPVESQIAALNNVRTELDRPLRTGAVDPATNYDKHLANLKSAGIDEIIAEAQKQLDAWLAVKK